MSNSFQFRQPLLRQQYAVLRKDHDRAPHSKFRQRKRARNPSGVRTSSAISVRAPSHHQSRQADSMCVEFQLRRNPLCYSSGTGCPLPSQQVLASAAVLRSERPLFSLCSSSNPLNIVEQTFYRSLRLPEYRHEHSPRPMRDRQLAAYGFRPFLGDVAAAQHKPITAREVTHSHLDRMRILLV